MKIISFDYDTEAGFAWITVEGGPYADSEPMLVQCCLTKNTSTENVDGVKYLNVIKCDDCGENWGLSGDANEKAFEYWGANKCMNALFKKAKESGLDVIGL